MLGVIYIQDLHISTLDLLLSPPAPIGVSSEYHQTHSSSTNCCCSSRIKYFFQRHSKGGSEKTPTNLLPFLFYKTLPGTYFKYEYAHKTAAAVVVLVRSIICTRARIYFVSQAQGACMPVWHAVAHAHTRRRWVFVRVRTSQG